MAIWTMLKASAIATSVVRHVCSSGTKIYYVDDSADDVYEYDPATNTETLIIDRSAITDYVDTKAIAWFNGNLYVFNYYGGGITELRVQRWSGTPNALTTVKTFTLDGGPTQTSMMADGSTIVAFTVDNPASPAAYSAECWYSADGSSWSAGGWNVSVWSPPDLNGGFSPTNNTAFPTGLYREFVTTTNAGRTTTTEKSIFKFISGVWTKIAALNTGPDEIYYYSSPNESIHWTVTTGERYDSAFASATTISGTPPVQIYQVNMPYSVAIDFTPASLYQYAAGAWSVLDVFNPAWDLSPNVATPPALVLMDSGDPYLIAYASTGGTPDIRIFGRDTPIVPVAPPSAFYYGRGNLRNRAVLPFEFINIGGLSISYPFAILGAGVSGSPMVAFAGPANNYAGFTDFTGGLSDDPIVAFDSTPYGNSQAAEGSGEDSGPGGGLSNGKC